MENNYYVYVYLDTRKPGEYIYENLCFDYEPFYVGKGKGNRLRHHLHNSNKNTNTEKRKIIKDIINETSNHPFIVKIFDNINNDKANFLEIKTIKLIGRKDLGLGSLVNKTNGGDGSDTSMYRIYCNLSEETKGKISKKKKGSSWGMHSNESKKKISESNKGKQFSEEHKKKLSISRKKRVTSDKTKEKMSKASKGKINIKTFKLIDPLGKEHVTTMGLTIFCQENNLTCSNIIKVINGQRKHHKGWTAERIS